MTSQITRATTCLKYCLHNWHTLIDDDAFINDMQGMILSLKMCLKFTSDIVTLKPLIMRKNF